MLLRELQLLASKEINIEQKLKLYSFLTSCLLNNYSSTFSNKALELDLIEQSKIIIDFDLPQYTGSNHVLHVVTEAYTVGGHSRVINNWIKSSPQLVHSILVNSHLKPVPNFLVTTVGDNGGVIIINEQLTLVDKAIMMAKVASQYKYIVLHHHPDDILPLLALGTPKFKRPTFLYNHADHIWGCGYSVCDKIFELTLSGIEFAHKYRGIRYERIMFMSIPIEITSPQFNQGSKSIKRVISVASAFKYYPTSKYNFQEFLHKLLSIRCDIVCIIIGVTDKDKYWTKLKNEFPERLKLLGVLPKSEVINYLDGADLYLDSFPFLSYTSCIEAISYQVPAVSLKTPVSQLDSYADLAVDSIDLLLKRCSEILDFTLLEKQQYTELALQKIKDHHSYASFSERVCNLDSFEEHNPLLLSEDMVKDQKIVEYTDFISELLRQQKFKFKPKLFSELSYVNRLRISCLVGRYSLKKMLILFCHANNIFAKIIIKIHLRNLRKSLK